SPLKAVAPGILPPCFIVGAGDDSWCLADSLALAQALSAVVSPYELHVMEGIAHGFMQMSTLEAFRAAMRLMWECVARNVCTRLSAAYGRRSRPRVRSYARSPRRRERAF